MSIYILNDGMGTSEGPYSIREVQRMIREKRLHRGQLIRNQNSNEWKPAADAFASFFGRSKRRSRKGNSTNLTNRLEEKSTVVVARSRREPQKTRSQRIKEELALYQTEPSRWVTWLKTKAYRRSKYLGFDILKVVIDVCMLTIVLAVGSLLLVNAISSLAEYSNLINQVVNSSFTFLQSPLEIALAGILSVVGLFFFRNVIDWMIDIEANTRAR